MKRRPENTRTKAGRKIRGVAQLPRCRAEERSEFLVRQISWLSFLNWRLFQLFLKCCGVGKSEVWFDLG